MKETAFKVLREIEEAGFEAYIVGGFVRDTLLGITSNDIDITTNATPKDLCTIFKDAILPSTEYGSVTIFVKQIRFEITTFRKELEYQKNRQPLKIVYIQDLKEDLLRRDFTVNTICMDQTGKIIDLLKGKEALEKREIQTVHPALESFSLDALRILRAIRFATILDFSLSEEIKEAIFQTKDLLRNLSYERKKQELDKIFTSHHVKKGIEMLLSFGLETILEIPKLKNIQYFPQGIGIWSFLEVESLYPFTKNEKELMHKIRDASLHVLEPYSLYKNGLYASCVAGEMHGLSKKRIASNYQNLPIKKRSDLQVQGMDILKAIRKKPGPYVSHLLNLLEKEVVQGKLENDKEQLLNYCLQNESVVGYTK